MHKRVFLVAVLLLLLAVFVPVKREIHMSVPCEVLDQQNDSFSGSTYVHFSGTYTDYLLFQDRFHGRIYCPDYLIMTDSALPTNLVTDELDEIMSYHHNGTIADIRYYASTWLEEDLNRFFIWVHEPDENIPGASHGRWFLCPVDMTFADIYNILSGR